jgi:hypothetical protein
MTFNKTQAALSRLFILLTLLVAAQGMTAAQDNAQQYVTWTEADNRFAFNIPYGWNVEAYVMDVLGEAAPYVFVFEPEERAVITAGAPSSEIYVDSPTYAEGEAVTLEGHQFIARAYEAPTDTLEQYLRSNVLTDTCDTIFIVLKADAEPTDVDSAAAQIDLECHYDGTYANGHFYMQTLRLDVPDVGVVWMPTDFYGYLAEPDVEGLTQAALEQIKASFVVNETTIQPDETVVSNTVDTMTQQTDDSGYDPDAFLAAQQELYQQQQTTAMISNMLQMQHETSMAIINNIGSSNTTYDYEWVWTP